MLFRSGIKTEYAPIPYNFGFTLSIYVRNTEDGTQILEQILPFFTPDFTVTVKFNEGMPQKYDMPIILNSATPEVDYEGDMMSTRLIIWTLDFTAKGYIWPAVKDDIKEIRKANTNITIDSNTRVAQKVYVDYATGNNYFQVGESFVSDDGVTGNIAYFSNTSSGVLVVENVSKLLQANDHIRGAKTNAYYKVSALDHTPVRTVIVLTTPVPSTANADDEFGFSEQIFEFPNT